MNSNRFRRLSGATAVWVLKYNAIWGIAWYWFMRDEWTTATTASHREMPWSAAAWHIWVLATVPLGLAIMAYAQNKPRPYRAALAAGLGIALIFQLGLAGYGGAQGLGWRVIALDTLVSLVATTVACIAGAWTMKEA